MDTSLLNDQFPRSNRYNPDWVIANISGGANPLWIAEWLCEAVDLQAGMRVLDLGCGRAMSSIFLHREFGVQVWATDLWFSASENLRLIRDAGAGDGVFPIHAEAHALPYATGFFDAVVSIDSFPYYGTDEHYLNYIARFVRPGGQIGVAGAGLTREIDGQIPKSLTAWWEPAMWCLHSPTWWQRHWEKTGIVDMEQADAMPDGWRPWLQWQKAVAPDNVSEVEALELDRGSYLGYVRTIARRRPDAKLDEPITSMSMPYTPHQLLRGAA